MDRDVKRGKTFDIQRSGGSNLIWGTTEKLEPPHVGCYFFNRLLWHLHTIELLRRAGTHSVGEGEVAAAIKLVRGQWRPIDHGRCEVGRRQHVVVRAGCAAGAGKDQVAARIN